jgi:hypothetical protein
MNVKHFKLITTVSLVGIVGTAAAMASPLAAQLTNTSYHHHVSGQPIKSIPQSPTSSTTPTEPAIPVTTTIGSQPPIPTKPSSTTTSVVASSPTKSPTFLFALSGLINLTRSGLNSTALSILAKSSPMVIDDNQVSPIPSPTMVTDFKSTATALSALNANQVKTPYILIDLEHWADTPLDEQLDPSVGVAEVAKVAHEQGIKLIVSLGTDLALNMPGSGTIYTKFQASQIAKTVAPYADVYEIQAQGLENNPTAFAAFTDAIRAQVLSVNPALSVLSAVTSSERNGLVTMGDLQADWYKTHNAVTGYWVNAPESASSMCASCGTVNVSLIAAWLNWVLIQ